KSYAGWKLVEGRSRRVITDTQAVQDRLIKEGYKVEKITETKLLSITNLEKLVGKKAFNELVGDYIGKPPGKVTLAKETDKRKAIIQSAEDEFDKI
ncbi:TPA: DUF2800 domain-containing protein, partial [Staphylococcus delphini]|nr:DUF2800 domain-containing protein [Staphylococcus delphini]